MPVPPRPPKHRRRLRQLLAGLALLPLCSASLSAADLTIALQTDVTSLDPHVAPTFTSAAMQEHLYGSLVAMDQDFRLTPGLAASLQATGDTRWDVTLREDVRFSDGSALTADDVAYSLRRAGSVTHPAGSAAPYVAAIRKVTVLGPHRLELETASPYPQLWLDLARVRIVRAKLGDAVRTEDFNRGAAAIGTGPYRLLRWTPGEALELARNPDYSGYAGPAPSWERVTFRPISSDAARLAALLSGDVDVIDKVSMADIARLRGDARVSLFAHEGNRTMFLVPDAARAQSPFVTDRNGQPLATNPLMDLRVRQAISLAMNRDALVERVLEGQGVAANQAAPAGMFGGASLPPIAHDPARARALLAEAGYPNGFRLTLHCSNGRYVADRATCLAAAQMLTRVGITTAAEAEPQNVFYPRMSRFDASLLLNGWGSIGDNLVVLRQALHTPNRDAGYGGFNRGRYSNPAVDALIEQAGQTIDNSRREALQQQAMATAMSDLGVIPLYTPSWVWAARRGLHFAAGFDEGTRAGQVSLVQAR
jgi:peptide/nickel transport system substrate-binding protein